MVQLFLQPALAWSLVLMLAGLLVSLLALLLALSSVELEGIQIVGEILVHLSFLCE